jgi:Zn-dependent peptidase ImmA (M78 family)
MNNFDGLPKSTYYYRKKHPKKTSFADIAKEFGVTRQCIYIFAKRNGISDMDNLRAEYALHQQKVREQHKKAWAKYKPFYVDYEVIASEPCENGYVRPEKQSNKDKHRNIIRLNWGKNKFSGGQK